MNTELLDLLERLEEYMDNYADADHNGESHVPNTEMKFLGEIREAIEKLKAT